MGEGVGNRGEERAGDVTLNLNLGRLVASVHVTRIAPIREAAELREVSVRGSAACISNASTSPLKSFQHAADLLEMSSTSQKHRSFVAEPMGEKPVTALAGIGDTLGGRLIEQGFDRAYVVLGQFLVLKKEEELFKEWLKEVCNANSKQSSDCFTCLREWCDAFL
ncbi:barrier-to-autointegration factor isoform X1 [Petromyzon marinus]|uniref:Barrier-to-autointegration factor-like protein n=2 Tax=Petromyzon marinus TaxID=7757 RepID=A0AAJ7U5D6_PETMA|nr:barrier-to-autointegration factor isoform X1 [Petromyzon marinus]